MRWEYWPIWFFYIPVVLYALWLSIKYRGLTLFSIANPKMTFGGIFGDDKASSLEAIKDTLHSNVPVSVLLTGDKQRQITQALDYAKKKGFPFVLKPNLGCRGQGVSIVNDPQQLHSYYHSTEQQDILLQEYVEGLEFGIFYIRSPEAESGSLFSIAEKTFPVIKGDGISGIEQLILTNPQLLPMASYYLKKHQHQLSRVLPKGEKLTLVDIGSHCRGAIFIEANHLMSEPLRLQIDNICKSLPEFYFGRLDIRVSDLTTLMKGQGIKVLEVNGVTSEAAHIYDSKNSVFKAYKVMFEQWELAYKVGSVNRARGYKPYTLRAIVGRLFKGYTDKKSKDVKSKKCHLDY